MCVTLSKSRWSFCGSRSWCTLLLWPAASIAFAGSASAQEEGGDDPGAIQAALQAVIEWAVCFFVELVKPIIQRLIDLVPVDATIETLNWAAPHWYFVNDWIPVPFVTLTMAAWITFMMSFIVIKFIVKAIPGVG